MTIRRSLTEATQAVWVHMPGRKAWTASLWTEAGPAYEPEEYAGLSHLIEHLLARCSLGPEGRHLISCVERVGGNLEAFTTPEAMCIWATVPVAHKGWLVTSLARIVSATPIISADALTLERHVIANERRERHGNPELYIRDLLDAQIWPAHPFGRGVLGREDSLSRLTVSDVQEFLHNQVASSRLVLTMVGDSELDAESLLQPLASRRVRRSPREGQAPPPPRGPGVTIQDREIDQAHLAVGFRALPRRACDYWALQLLNVLLGGTMSSRLFKMIREEHGLAYNLYSWTRSFVEDGFLKIYLACSPDNTQRALRLILQELLAIGKGGPVDSEFEWARQYLRGHLEVSLDDTLELALWLGEGEFYGGLAESIESTYADIELLTPKRLCKVAAELFRPDNLQVAVIGPGPAAAIEAELRTYERDFALNPQSLGQRS